MAFASDLGIIPEAAQAAVALTVKIAGGVDVTSVRLKVGYAPGVEPALDGI
jgi:hypothetical protein